MTEHSSISPFTWVYKRDGRLVPFEADKISRSLFAAGEGLGRPDAFLARELTDGILHFLAVEAEGTIPTTTQIAELVVKVVRELGQPALAQAYAEVARKERAGENGERKAKVEQRAKEESVPLRKVAQWVESAPPAVHLAWGLSKALLEDYSLQNVYTRDLAAAHNEGLLVLGNLGCPLELAGCVFRQDATERGLVEVLQEARSFAGDFLALDCPEYGLMGEESIAAGYARELRLGLAATGLRMVVNLNSAQPPVWAGELAEGPLFAGRPRSPEPPAALVDMLLDHLLAGEEKSGLRVDWHVADRDFAGGTSRLLRVARRALEGTDLTFVFDRPRRPMPLAEGLDRQRPATLLTVGLNLPRLAAQPAVRGNPALFLEKLRSLVRMALSAASQKRDFLRRHRQGRPAVARGFLLNRARLVLAPIGLEATVQNLANEGLCALGSGMELGRQIVHRLRDSLREDGGGYHLDGCLDAPASFTLSESNPEDLLSPFQVAGLSPWDIGAEAKHQVRAAGLLHGGEAGTAAVLLQTERLPSPEQVVELLRHAWEETQAVRIRFIRITQPQRQLTAPWEEV